MTTRSATSTDPIVTAALALLGVLAASDVLLWLAGAVSAQFTRVSIHAASLGSGWKALASPAEPGLAFGAIGLSPVAYWTTAALLTAAACAIAATSVLLVRRVGAAPKIPTEGTAPAAEVRRIASPASLIHRAAVLRPGLAHARPAELGYLLGGSRGGQVWVSVEDSILLIGPPRSGKGHHLVIPALLDAPGAVLTTSTRPDNLAVTLRARERIGTVAVFDPQRLAPGIGADLRWSPIRGCQHPLTAMIRARGLAASTGFRGVEGGGFWEGKTQSAIQCLLHAAALDGRDTRELYRWTVSLTAANDATRILSSNPHAADGWAEALEGILTADPRTRDSVWHGVSLAFAALADPRVLDALSPVPGREIDPAQFLEQRGTLYLLATAAGSGATAALVAALIEDVLEVARRRAAASAGARLDPPLLLALDEIGNLAPLPALPALLAEGGGSGITTLAVLQSLAQARDKWGDHAAHASWDAATVKILLGGSANPRDLADLAQLSGEKDETTESTTHERSGGRSWQRSKRRVSVLPPETLRTLPFGTAMVMFRSARPMVVRLQSWPTRKDGRRLGRGRLEIESLIQQAHAREVAT